jgi:hypothetical protein
VILDGEAIDGRLPTAEDGPALLEVLHAYQPVLREYKNLLLRRWPGPVPEVLGDVLLERELRFGEAVDLAALGPTAKAISLEIDDGPLDRLRAFFDKPAAVLLEVTFDTDETRTFAVVPGMVREPVLIDPLPVDLDDLNHLTTGVPLPRVRSVRLVLGPDDGGPDDRAPVGCRIWSLPNLAVAPDPPDR